jgi:protein-L-isoaspartate O-methyltransferase
MEKISAASETLKGNLEQSWTVNASGWVQAVREAKIESRRVATDAAILEVIQARKPHRVLDVGCGEG